MVAGKKRSREEKKKEKERKLQRRIEQQRQLVMQRDQQFLGQPNNMSYQSIPQDFNQIQE
jgi:hypothetical protein